MANRLGCSISAWFVVLALFVMPTPARAQEAAIAGSIVDSTGGVLPGVTVTVLHEATGNTFEAVTDSLGVYRLPVRVGTHRVTADLAGFTSVTRRVELLVGQTATLDLQMAPSTVEETVTVTAEAPLVDVSGSQVRSAIDPRQMQELPVNGRNWLDLSLMAAGARHNVSSDTLGSQLFSGEIQINIDGLRVTQQLAARLLQPKYSRDAIAEFEVITNRFDATLGGATNSVVNAVSKSGTNTTAGTVSGYFRDDSLIAEDFVVNRVLPYSNQQLSGTLGGPVVLNRMHYFGNFEYEREPQTVIFNSPYPSFNVALYPTKVQKKTGGRTDLQFTPQSRLTVRGTWFDGWVPSTSTGGATLHPSRAAAQRQQTSDLSGMLTSVIGERSTNSLNIGYAGARWTQEPEIPWAGHPYGFGKGSPTIELRGYGIGTPFNWPQDIQQDAVSVKDDFLFSFAKGGRHDVKTGVEVRGALRRDGLLRVRRPAGGAGRPGAGERAESLPGVERPDHLEPGGALADCAVLRDQHRLDDGAPLGEQLFRLAAG